jgi:hypothetical protein
MTSTNGQASSQSARLWPSESTMEFYCQLLQCSPPRLVVGKEYASGEERRIGRASWDDACFSAASIGSGFPK